MLSADAPTFAKLHQDFAQMPPAQQHNVLANLDETAFNSNDPASKQLAFTRAHALRDQVVDAHMHGVFTGQAPQQPLPDPRSNIELANRITHTIEQNTGTGDEYGINKANAQKAQQYAQTLNIHALNQIFSQPITEDSFNSLTTMLEGKSEKFKQEVNQTLPPERRVEIQNLFKANEARRQADGQSFGAVGIKKLDQPAMDQFSRLAIHEFAKDHNDPPELKQDWAQFTKSLNAVGNFRDYQDATQQGLGNEYQTAFKQVADKFSKMGINTRPNDITNMAKTLTQDPSALMHISDKIEVMSMPAAEKIHKIMVLRNELNNYALSPEEVQQKSYYLHILSGPAYTPGANTTYPIPKASMQQPFLDYGQGHPTDRYKFIRGD